MHVPPEAYTARPVSARWQAQGGGRKPKGKRAGESHARREEFKARHPLHVVMRVVPAVGNMRKRSLYQALRAATITAALRERIRIVHVSIQQTHVHMIVEAEDKRALGRGCRASMCRRRGT